MPGGLPRPQGVARGGMLKFRFDWYIKSRKIPPVIFQCEIKAGTEYGTVIRTRLGNCETIKINGGTRLGTSRRAFSLFERLTSRSDAEFFIHFTK